MGAHRRSQPVHGALTCPCIVQFNLETPDPETFKEHTRIYRSISTAHAVPLFQLQVLLCIPELATNQVLVYLAPDSSRVRIDPTPRYIVLESWTLEHSPHSHSQPHSQDVAPSTMYKYGIPLFRSLFTLLRVLPSWKLARRLRRRVGGNRGGNFSIQLRVDGVDSSVRAGEVMSFGESLVYMTCLEPWKGGFCTGRRSWHGIGGICICVISSPPYPAYNTMQDAMSGVRLPFPPVDGRRARFAISAAALPAPFTLPRSGFLLPSFPEPQMTDFIAASLVSCFEIQIRCHPH